MRGPTSHAAASGWITARSARGCRAHGISRLEVSKSSCPPEPEGRVRALITQGEGPSVKFKRALPTSTAGSLRKIMKTIAAFANADGGDLLFGIDPDEIGGAAGAEAGSWPIRGVTGWRRRVSRLKR
jgi:Schlafen, AlbA_2